MLKFQKLNKPVAFTMFLVLLVVACLGESAIAKPNASRKSLQLMEAYCTYLDRTVVGGLDCREFFQKSPQTLWREHTSKNYETANAFCAALTYPRKGSPLGANIFLDEQNQDWSKILTLYFRVDGTLIKSELRFTGRGDNKTVAHQVKYFDGKGNQVFTVTKSTKGKKRKSKSINLSSIKVPQYRTVKELPFYSLLAVKSNPDSKPQPKG